MIRREDCQFRHATPLVESNIDREFVIAGFTRLYKSGMPYLALKIDFQPVSRILPCDIGVEFGGRPFREGCAEFLLRDVDALRAVHFREAACQHGFGFVIKRAHKLSFPAVPHAGADATYIGGREDRQQLHLFDGLDDRSEILDGFCIGEVARLSHGRHREMFLNQPRDKFCVGCIESEAWT